MIGPMKNQNNSNTLIQNLMDRIHSLVLEICGVDLNLVLMNTLSKDTVSKDEMSYDSDGTKWESKM